MKNEKLKMKNGKIFTKSAATVIPDPKSVCPDSYLRLILFFKKKKNFKLYFVNLHRIMP